MSILVYSFRTGIEFLKKNKTVFYDSIKMCYFSNLYEIIHIDAKHLKNCTLLEMIFIVADSM